MVVSKDSKRKRKESPQTQSAVESSPEMPKRTKVQAQRKFAQGQSAPASSSYNSVIAASSSSNTGPSTSSESREPPTEILPNKRPKTEDFLTFLCFRGTPALPAHCDFLNQGKSKDPEIPPVKRNASNPVKASKKSKKGKPKAAAKNEEPKASTSSAQPSVPPADNIDKNETITTKVTQIEENNVIEATAPGTSATSVPIVQPLAEDTVIPFAVRKRAEVITEGNRRSRATERQLRNAAPNAEKCNNSPEIKRRSNRTGTKDIKPIKTDPETDDEDDEYFSANDEAAKVESGKEHAVSTRNEPNKSKTPILSERKSETPSKESETGKTRKGRPASTTKKAAKDILKENSANEHTSKNCLKVLQRSEQPVPVKEKAPVKRPRQKESPIFIPSPEPSGRMTRQRAFFEPVKVPHRNEETEIYETEKSPAKIEVIQTEVVNKTENSDISSVKVAKELKVSVGKSIAKTAKLDDCAQNVNSDKGKSNLNVFDFSSDDEQPLAKSIKLKKGKGSAKKVAAPRANKTTLKLSPKKVSETKNEIKTKFDEKLEATNIKTDTNIEPHKDAKEENQEELERSKNMNKRGKNLKKKADDEIVEENKELAPPSPKKASFARQSRKKAKATEVQVKSINGEDEAEAPVRSQRPTRKTKEAAAIYMGIIGHKLQLADDEDDDLSLNSFPDLPNVKRMVKMENEIKKNAVASEKNACSVATVSPTAVSKISPKQTTTLTIDSSAVIEKPVSARRGRPPKQTKQQQSPVKREIEGMLVKKGAISKMSMALDGSSGQNRNKSEPSKADSDDEDFLLNEEVNETKRKLEKSFSDSDDEPLAIKANVKSNEKDVERNEISHKSEIAAQSTTIATAASATTLAMLPLTAKPVPTPSLNTLQTANASSPITAPQQQFQQQNTSPAPPTPFKTIEKKSPVPTSKILNVPATYAIPMSNSSIPQLPNVAMNANFNKTTSYLPQPSPLYHTTSHIVRQSPAHQFPTAKSPTGPPATSSIPATHLSAPPPPPPQSPLKYQTAPTTYPPPIEAYPSPKINPNFLTPKFDRTTLPRPNNFPSPSPVRFDVSSSTTPASKTAGIAPNTAIGIKTTGNVTVTVAGGNGNGSAVPPGGTNASTSAATCANVTANADPLKDEIGSILAANLMPSKEESGKIFGIASVSLAQSSGPDNTKCTLGKCGSIHKPVLGPVVPTEGYIGDQLSSKERRKAKVNMTHEQIQKWLIECSSNPDEIQDDLDDDFDDNLRPNLFVTTPPPTRDDKESTSFSSSSKATRDLGKSESAWSAKGPSLKATPVVATPNRKDDSSRLLDAINQPDIPSDNEKTNVQAINLTHKTSMKQNSNSTSEVKAPTKLEKSDKKSDKKPREERTKAEKESTNKDSNKTCKIDKEKDSAISNDAKLNVTGKQPSVVANQNQTHVETPTTSKPNRRKNIAGTSTVTSSATVEKASTSKVTAGTDLSVETTAATATVTKQPKRTPVYNQKAQMAQKQVELKVTTTTSHKRTAPFSYIAFSADNEKSIYSFDKDDEEVDGSKAISKPPFRRQSRRDSHLEEAANTTTISTRASPTKKRAAAAAAEKANKDIANASQSSSVSLTLSPSENCKHVKVSLDAEKTVAAATTTTTTPKTTSGKASKSTQKTEIITAVSAAAGNVDADSDSDGHTFYIPLQGSGTGGDGEGGIQGVAVKLGREGPDGPNQKVIMHATLVTKAQMGSNSKPLPDSMNVSDIVKTLMTSSNVANIANTTSTAESSVKKSNTSHPNVMPSTSAAAAAAAAATATSANSASNSLKSVPIGTVQPRFKASDSAAANQPTTSNTAATGGTGAVTSSGLVRVNSNSSLFSGSAKSRICGIPGPTVHGSNKKFKDDTPIKMSNNTAFPRHDDPTQMVEAPIFRPTEKEFADPIDFIERITPIAARFGICKIIPPATFKPECRISDEMRFTAYNQYVHKMLHRWGPSAKEFSAIKKYLGTQSIVMNHPPWIGGMEVDLPRLYHTVQELGGLKEVIEKKKWTRVAEEMCIPKLAQDRVTKLDDIYCKYLLPYDTLSPAERQKLFDEVEADWAKREARARRNADRFVNTESVSNEEEDVSSEDDEESEEEVDGVSMECIVKGRNMPLSQFYRIARNTMALWFKNTEPIVNEVEAEFWRHVAVRDSHVCVHSGSIDSSGWGYGFPTPGPKGKSSNYSRHPWNLKVLTNNPSSVLRSLGPVMGVTVPTLHVGMLFSACCWYRDPHGLSWIEYLHTGASKLWYGIPDDQSANFRAALTSLIPTHCQNKTIWLPCDTVMVPPHMLTDRGVSLCRIEQKPGEFIVVFPRAYTSSLATGYVVSESVYFATTSWLELAKDDFRDIHDSCEPAMFSLEQLLFALGYDQRVTSDTLQQTLPMLYEVCEKETAAREQLKAAGVTSTEKVHSEKGSKAKKQQQPPFKSIDNECDFCRANLYISMVKTEDGNVYCLQHALKNLNNGNIQAKQCKLIYAYNLEDIENLIKNLKDKIQIKRNAIANKKVK